MDASSTCLRHPPDDVLKCPAMHRSSTYGRVSHLRTVPLSTGSTGAMNTMRDSTYPLIHSTMLGASLGTAGDNGLRGSQRTLTPVGCAWQDASPPSMP